MRLPEQKSAPAPAKNASPASRKPAPTVPLQMTAAGILQMQKQVGNRAVAHMLAAQRKTKQTAQRTADKGNGGVIQRYDITYGPLQNDSGTDMHVLIEGKSDKDLGKGSKPSIKPNWWPTSQTDTQDVVNYFENYMVQGHLLNEELGGPGWTMQNLTPITRSTNTTHFKQIEAQIKHEVFNNDNYVEYRVIPKYNTHPTLSELGNNAPAGVAKYLPYLAGSIEADYTLYDKKTKNKIGGLPGAKIVRNEGAHLKGTY